MRLRLALFTQLLAAVGLAAAAGPAAARTPCGGLLQPACQAPTPRGPRGRMCEALGVAPIDLRIFGRFVRVYQRTDSAYRVGSVRRYRSGLRQLERVQADFKDFRSPKRQQLRDFRASCR